MGDRTYFRMTVTACPAEQADALAEAMARIDPFGATDPATLTAELRELADDGGEPVAMAVEEAAVGTIYDGDWQAVVSAAPDAAWLAFEAPRYEWTGSLALYHPDTGLSLGECDADGNETVTADQTRSRLDEAGIAEVDALVAVLFPTDAAHRLVIRP